MGKALYLLGLGIFLREQLAALLLGFKFQSLLAQLLLPPPDQTRM